MTVPHFTLNNGRAMPMIGLGTWQAKPGEVENAVKLAIDCGYRHFDCAMVYMNEAEIGSAIREKIAEGVVKREDLFITSKLWNTFHNRSSVVPMCRKTLDNFGLDYIDLYLIHWPFGFQETGDNIFPRGEDGKVLFSDDDYVDTWFGMEECVDLGLTKSIGVSNFNQEQIQRILDVAYIKPVTNQIECHPYLVQRDLIAWCQEQKIVTTAYSPLGSAARPWAQATDPILLDDPELRKLAEKYKKTPAQIVLNYLLSLGIVVIPKTTNPERLKENFNVFDFKLEKSDLALLEKLNRNERLCNFNDANTHKYYPFVKK